MKGHGTGVLLGLGVMVGLGVRVTVGVRVGATVRVGLGVRVALGVREGRAVLVGRGVASELAHPVSTRIMAMATIPSAFIVSSPAARTAEPVGVAWSEHTDGGAANRGHARRARVPGCMSTRTAASAWAVRGESLLVASKNRVPRARGGDLYGVGFSGEDDGSSGARLGNWMHESRCQPAKDPMIRGGEGGIRTLEACAYTISNRAHSAGLCDLSTLVGIIPSKNGVHKSAA